jgi:hypothetical protein
MKRSDIKANTISDWSDSRAKFRPNELVRVNVGYIVDNPDYTRSYRSHNGQVGVVIAASAASDGRMRGINLNSRTGWRNRRQYTKYYVEFENGDVVGYHSHHLKPAK